MSAYISVKEAAELAGVSKSALFKAINSGRLSAEKEPDGAWKIQVVELERVYPLNGTQRVPAAANNSDSIPKVHDHPQEAPKGFPSHSADSQQVLIEQLQLRLQEHEATLADLRKIVDVLTNENNRLAAVIAQLQPPKAKVGWWARLLRGA